MWCFFAFFDFLNKSFAVVSVTTKKGQKRLLIENGKDIGVDNAPGVTRGAEMDRGVYCSA